MNTQKWLLGGLQQIGIGVSDNNKSQQFYRTAFGFDITMFDETGAADIMAPYMGNKSWTRHASLKINIKGGGGLEIWQFTNRIPIGSSQEMSIANKGIIAAFIRCKNIYEIREQFIKNGYEISIPVFAPDNTLRCFVRDLEYNWICLVETQEGWFDTCKKKKLSAYSGGVCGALIGVSDMDTSIKFYQEICGYDIIMYDSTDTFLEYDILRGQQKVRRVQLKSSKKNTGTFAPLLTESFIELIEAKEIKEDHIFKDRFWGDLGFIHLCFDVRGMQELKLHCKKLGYDFSIDTGQEFTMDKASGRFAYLEDPDGTLIEFVEVYKLPILAKYNIVFNLAKHPLGKPLPKIFLKALQLRKDTPSEQV